MANWQIECKDVMTWCKEYKGEPFSAMICDPPYHLTTITKRFGKEGAAPAQYGRDGAFQRVSKGFMGSTWDGETDGVGIAFRSETWAALSEHLLPGAFGMAFASSRGWHRLACAIEDAGLRIHPSIFCWAQGQGFCKATNIHLQLEKRLCYQDESKDWFYKDDNKPIRTKPPFRHPSADQFYGHRYGGQALAPKVEPIIVFQKPYEGRPVDSIVETGAGSLWIDGGRVQGTVGRNWAECVGQGTGHGTHSGHGTYNGVGGELMPPHSAGRWPPNFALCHVSPSLCAACDGDGCDECNNTGLVGGCRRVGTKRVKGGNDPRRADGSKSGVSFHGYEHDHRPCAHSGHADTDGYEETAAWECVESCAAHRIGEQSGERIGFHGFKAGAERKVSKGKGGYHDGFPDKLTTPGHADAGTAARFFPQFGWAAEIAERLANSDQVRYCAKASRSERDAGLSEAFPLHDVGDAGRYTMSGDMPQNYTAKDGKGRTLPRRNIHSTVKPISLCTWLAKLLLAPPEYAPRRILIPFAGVMSEAIAAMLTGWEEIVAVEMSEEYCAIGEARLKFWSQFNSYEEAMDAARNIQQAQRKQDAQIKNGQLKLSL